MADVEKKRRGSKAALKVATLTGSAKRQYSRGTARPDELLAFADQSGQGLSPSMHLLPFYPPGSPNILLLDQGAELEKLSSKLFGIPLLSGTNFGLRLHPESEPHVPLLIKDTVDWLAHYVHDEQDTITSLLTEDPDKGLLERLVKKVNKDALASLSQNIHAPTVWHLLLAYISSLPETPITFDCYKELIVARSVSDIPLILQKLPQENKSLLKRLLWLMAKFHDQTRTPVEEQLLVSTFSQLFFNVTQPDYQQLMNSTPLGAAATADGSTTKRDKLFGIVTADTPLAQLNRRELLTSSLLHCFMESAETLSQALSDYTVPSLLAEENIMHRVYRVRIGSFFSNATLWLTGYRLIIQLKNHEEISIPYLTIRTAEMVTLSQSKKKKSRSISISTRDYRAFQLEFEAPLYAVMFWDVLHSMLTPKSALKLFAFRHKPDHGNMSSSQGWGMYDAVDEFERQGMVRPGQAANEKPTAFRMSKLNSNYESSPTYPASWLVPNTIDDSELRKLLPTRLRSRIPIVTWGKPNGGVILRADELDVSEAKDAKSLNKLSPDLRLIDAMAASGCKSRFIVDVGPPRTYKYSYSGTDWQIKFLNITNNRDLAQQYVSFLESVENNDKKANANLMANNILGTPSISKGGISTGVQLSLEEKETSLESPWTVTLQSVLSTATSIASLIASKSACVLLTHSAGNDMDFVISSLIQVMLDGHYRTIDGLAVLLEKDWCSFGYDWSRKLGHQPVIYNDETPESVSSSSATSSATSISPTTPEQSPCIDLFIEAIWQMTLQFPMHFEYTEPFLIAILEAVYSGRFGTFLLNTEKERDAFVKNRTVSFWAHIHHHLQTHPDNNEFVNLFYDPDTSFTILDPRYETSALRMWCSKHLYQHQYAEMIAINSLVEAACNNLQSPIPPPSAAPVKSASESSISVSNKSTSLNNTAVKENMKAPLLREASKIGTSAVTNVSSGSSEIMSIDGSMSETVSVTSETGPKETSPAPDNPTTLYSGIVELNLSRRALKLIPQCVTIERNAAKLHSLNFSHNRLNFFPSDILRLTRLRRLNLSNNPIGDISRDHFFMMGNRMVQLQQLDLSNIGLAYLPDDISTMRFLRLLIIKENQLTELPPNISSLTKLEVLDVRKNRLKSIPHTVFKLNTLRVLALGDNAIEIDLPLTPIVSSPSLDRIGKRASQGRSKAASSAVSVSWSFRNLTSLEVLDWKGNARSSDIDVPETIFLLPAAKSLHLEDNNLEALPSLIGKMTTLTYLNLSYNQLVTLPEELTQLPNLTSFIATNNRLWCLPPQFCRLPLTSLDLSNNRFKEIPVPVLNTLSITSLNMSKNQIRHIPNGVVDNLVQLSTLLLNDNQIATLDNLPAICNLTQLAVLGLNGNQFERIPMEIAKLEGILKDLQVDSSLNTRIVFPPRDVLIKGTNMILRYLSERSSMGEADGRINVLVLGEQPGLKNTLLRRMLRSQKKDSISSSSSSSTPMLSAGAIGMGSVLSMVTTAAAAAPMANQSATLAPVSSSSAPTLEKYEWTISALQAASEGSIKVDTKSSTNDAPSSVGHLNQSTMRQTQIHTEVHTVVWEINLDMDTTRSFLHPSFLNDRSFYIVTWEIAPMKESLHNWLEIATSRSKKAQFLIIGFQTSDSAVTKDYVSSMETELAKKYGAAFRGFLVAPTTTKIDIKALQTKIEDSIMDSHLPRDTQPASYFTMEKMLLAMEVKPPILTYAYFESIAKGCGIRDMRKLMRHLSSMGLVLHLADSPILDHLLLLDPLWPCTFLSQLQLLTKSSIQSNGLVPHEAFSQMKGDKRFPPAVIPTLVAFMQALGLAFPLSILTQPLKENLGIISPPSEDACVAVEAFTQPPVPVTPNKDPDWDAFSTSWINPGFKAPFMCPGNFWKLHSWIPMFCEEAKPSAIAKMWPRYLPNNAPPTLQCGRKYVFSTSPLLLFSRFLSRLLALVKVDLLFKSGCIIVNSSGRKSSNGGSSSNANNSSASSTSQVSGSLASTSSALGDNLLSPLGTSTASFPSTPSKDTSTGTAPTTPSGSQAQAGAGSPGVTPLNAANLGTSSSSLSAPSSTSLSALPIGPAEVIHISLNKAQKTIKILCRTSAGVSVLSDVYETLDSLIREMKLVPASVTLPCPHCLEERLARAFHFGMDEVARSSVVPNSYMHCQEMRPIATKYIAPDMALSNIATDRHLDISEIDLIKLIGEGAAAEVFLGELKGELVAVKRLRVTKSSDGNGPSSDIMVGNDSTAKALAEFRREVRWLSKFKHAAVVGFKGIVLEPPCIITEYCDGGNLFEYCHPPKDKNVPPPVIGGPVSPRGITNPTTIAASYPINWAVRLKIALDIAEGMSLLHAHIPAIAHRDLKSPNILLQLSSQRERNARALLKNTQTTQSPSHLSPPPMVHGSLTSDSIVAVGQGSSGSLVNKSPSTPSLTISNKFNAASGSNYISVGAATTVGGSTSAASTQSSNAPDGGNQLSMSSSSVPDDVLVRKSSHSSLNVTTVQSAILAGPPKKSTSMASTKSISVASEVSKTTGSPSSSSSGEREKRKYPLKHTASLGSLEDRLNMWTAQDAIARLTDFGLTGLTPSMSGREVDNPVWLAPEVMLRGVEYGEQADVYSYGVILYEILTNKEYFGHLTFMTDIEKAVLAGQRPKLPPKPSSHVGPKLLSSSAYANAVSTSAITGPTSTKSDSPRAFDSMTVSAPNLKIPGKKDFSFVETENVLTGFPEDLYKVPEFIHLMDHCLADSPWLRPTFAEVVETLKYIIMLHPEHASNISFPPGSDLAVHSITTQVDVFPQSSLALDLVPETKNLEYISVGEPVNVMCSSYTSLSASTASNGSSSPAGDCHVWLGLASGTMSAYFVPTPRATMSLGGLSNTEEMIETLMQSDDSAIFTKGDTSEILLAEELNPLLIGTFRNHKGGIVSITPHLVAGNNVCSVAIDKSVFVWAVPKSEARDKPRTPFSSNLESLDDTPTYIISCDSVLTVSTKGGSLRVNDPAAGAKWKERKVGVSSPIGCILRIPYSTGFYWIGTERKILRLDNTMKAIDYIPVSDSQITCLTLVGPHVWCGSADKSIRVFHAKTGDLITSLTAHSDEVTAILHVGNQVWTASKDRSIIVWQRHNFHILKEIKKAHNDTITSLCLVHNQEVWSSSLDMTVGRWSLSPATRVSLIRGANYEEELDSDSSSVVPSTGIPSISLETETPPVSIDLSDSTSISAEPRRRSKKRPINQNSHTESAAELPEYTDTVTPLQSSTTILNASNASVPSVGSQR